MINDVKYEFDRCRQILSVEFVQKIWLTLRNEMLLLKNKNVKNKMKKSVS